MLFGFLPPHNFFSISAFQIFSFYPPGLHCLPAFSLPETGR